MTDTLTELPEALRANPVLSRWVRIEADGTVQVRSGKVELGQGTLTALAQLAAAELGVPLERVRMRPAETGSSPDEGYTAGSLSVQYSGPALRQVCAEVRAALVAEAARRWGLDPLALTVIDGRVCADDGRALDFAELADGVSLDRPATGVPAAGTDVRTGVVGVSAARLDLPDKVFGTPRFVQDLRLPGMRYGRVVRPPSRGATLSDVDVEAVRALPGVCAVLRDGNVLGVVAEQEHIAVAAAGRLSGSARWAEQPTLPDPFALQAFLTSSPVETTVPAEHGDPGEPGPDARSASYSRPYLAHASMAPSCAVARWDDGRLTVWSHTQGVYPLRGELAKALDLDVDAVLVRHVEGAGCYGHNGADDVALDAALLAATVPGEPVQVLWSRQDELGWAPFGTAAVVRVSAELDDAGDVRAWWHEIWGGGHVARPGAVPGVALLAAEHRAGGAPIGAAGEPPLNRGGGAARNSVPYYDFPAVRVTNHRLLEPPLRTSSLRSLGAFANVFAAESFVDELAAELGRDPVEYRLRQLSEPRALAVLELAAAQADWGSPTPEDVGRGVAFARYKGTSAYCAVVAEVAAETELRVRRLVIAVDAGRVVNPDGATNQIEGGAIQATSWTIREQVAFDRFRVTSDTWESYPILNFSEVPAVDVHLVPGEDRPSLGVGECAQGPTAAAIGNALYDALGVRVRDLPLTSERIVAAFPD